MSESIAPMNTGPSKAPIVLCSITQEVRQPCQVDHYLRARHTKSRFQTNYCNHNFKKSLSLSTRSSCKMPEQVKHQLKAAHFLQEENKRRKQKFSLLNSSDGWLSSQSESTKSSYSISRVEESIFKVTKVKKSFQAFLCYGP